ncbi:FKBP-type peptidyl-prolyl cis-trans isomerase [Mycobacterium sp. WMMD1722]|uniref:FKBP-type peptidyl-prolyl cis-trans isomerase n=1 Tax=Mycobacterium sp. WMMD1722 TaxID=3404117 RepID=UPI003BF61111
MAPVKLTGLPSSVALMTGAASLVVTLSACGSDASDTSSSDPSFDDLFSSSVTAQAASTCPAAAPPRGGTPEWTVPGTTGSVAVTGSTDVTAPQVEVTAPFSVDETQVHTLTPGDGPVVAPTASVSVCYMGVNGRDGSVFDTSFKGGPPVEFPLDGVVPGFQKAIAGQKVGSTVAVAMVPADGYPQGQPAAGIEPGDTLVFAIEIVDATN